MRREELYLRDIVEAADHLFRFVSQAGHRGFSESEMVRSSILQKLTVIGEAASRISEELRSRHPAVPWRKIVAFRNVVVHAYFGIDWDIVWHAATSEVPQLREQVEAILGAEFNDDTA
jgi:uncharacterized protein with HEPN domain